MCVILTDEKLTVLYANSNCRNLVPMARFRSYEGMALAKVLEDEHVLRYIELKVQEGRRRGQRVHLPERG